MSVLFRVASAVGLLLFLGCTSTTPTAEKTATAALAQLVVYETNVIQKIREENDYYTDVMDASAERVIRFWEDEQPFKFDQQARSFALQNAGVAEEQLGPTLVTFMDQSMQSWASRDQQYEDLLVSTQQTLRDNRQKLELELGQARSLRGTLQTLSEARSTKEMLLLTIAFAREVKVKYDELKPPPADTSETSADTSEPSDESESVSSTEGDVQR
jgi:hypothetical protein